MKQSLSAFSLVELSIVLVILGLLTGGILTGQSLIRAAELRAVTTEFQNYQTAIQTFRGKYFAVPGDMRNAEDFWTSMTNCGVASPSGSGTQTCNGDGDGSIDRAAASAQTGENFSIWQHLANAGLIEGTYTGVAGSSTTDADPGVNSPQSKLSGATWYVEFRNGGNGTIYDINYGNYLGFGADTSDGSSIGNNLTPEEAWGIDKKIDDGLPAQGKVIAHGWNDTCASADDGGSADDDYNASYRFSDDSVQCHLMIRNVF